MLPLETIIRTALHEHEHEQDNNEQQPHNSAVDSHSRSTEQLFETVQRQLQDLSSIPYYSHSSPLFSLVRFRCLLQDTGYPAEVYQPASADQTLGQDPWSDLKERWVGWGIQIPGEQTWAQEPIREDVSASLQNLTVKAASLPPSLQAKWTLPESRDSYLGALLKIYDDVQFKPASAYEMIGLVANAPLPASLTETEHSMVPAIHVVTEPRPIYPTSTPVTQSEDSDIRQDLVAYLSNAFNPPDLVAAEILLLSLLATPISRPPSMTPLGTLAVNLLRPSGQSVEPLLKYIKSVAPVVLSLPLSIDLLHTHPFRPAAVESSLNAGFLQMAPGTVLIIEEDHMGNGGQLSEKALKNLEALKDCISQQRVPYDYPFMDDLKMDCEVRPLVVSESKSLLPVDLYVSVELSDAVTSISPSQVDKFREYIAAHGAHASASRVSISEEVGEQIQLSFVADRRLPGGADAAESRLRSRMQLARLMASSRSGELSIEVWKAAVSLLDDATSRSPNGK